ncbi:MAG: fibronectin type III domain-containing protein, partial [Elusimicrobiota bacterium]|nr:fibronectin type III domain-containing protein [Elusimicrobiota bacterium]
GSSQSAVTNSSGIATVSYTAPAVSGAYNYTANFAGDSSYASSSDSTSTVTAGLRPTVTAGQVVATQASSTFTATAALTDSVTAGPVLGKTVSFLFEGSAQSAVTNSSGIATVSYTAPVSTGIYNYTANFAGDSSYAASSDTANAVTVGLRPTVMVAQNATTQANSTFTATATLTDSLASTLISGKSVLFTFQGTTQTATTNGSGVAVVTYTAPGTTGSYNYTASFAGDSVYAATSDSTNTVTVGLRPSSLVAQNVTTPASSTFTATAALTDDLTAGPISARTISFVFQGSAQMAVTNSSGIATAAYTAPASAGVFYYSANFAGDSVYAASSDSTNTVTVNVLPAQPSAPAGSALGVSSITWSWTALGGVSNYLVYSATAPSSLISSPSDAVYILTGLSPNTTYSIKVAGVNAAGEGPASPAATAVATLAYAPSSAAVSAVYATSATLNWGLNGNPFGTTAKVLRVNTSTTFTTSTTTYTDTGLLGCTSYTFQIWNVNRSNVATQYSALGPIFTGNPTPLPPGNLSAESLSGNRIRLTWEPAPFEGITGYILYSDDGTGTINYGIMLGGGIISGTSYTTDVLASSAAYKFSLRARHRCGVVETNTSVRATAASIFSLTGVRAAIKIPQSGKKVKGNSVTVMAELVTGTAADTKNIRLQYKLSASTTWQNIIAKDQAIHPNPDTTSPYFIHWDVTGLATGSYDLRAVATDMGDASDQSPAAITIGVDTADADINEDDSSGKVIKEQKVNNLVANILQAGDSSSAQVTKLEIPAGALDDSTVTVSVTNNPTLVPPAPPDAEALGIITEITLSNTQTELAGGQTAAITLLFPDADDDGIVDGTNLRASQLEMYSAHLLAGPWEKDLASTVDLVSKKVTGRTSHFSFFALFAPLAANLNMAKAYPVPWRPGSGDRFDSAAGVGFYNLTDKTVIKIYTITGQLVRELKLTAADTGNKVWDGKNSSGLKAASGVYLAHIKSGSSVKIIKIAVER